MISFLPRQTVRELVAPPEDNDVARVAQRDACVRNIDLGRPQAHTRPGTLARMGGPIRGAHKNVEEAGVVHQRRSERTGEPTSALVHPVWHLRPPGRQGAGSESGAERLKGMVVIVRVAQKQVVIGMETQVEAHGPLAFLKGARKDSAERRKVRSSGLEGN